MRESSQRNLTCGDEVTVHLVQGDGMIDALHWDGRGRVVSQALASILADLAAGTTALELLELIGMFRTMIRTHEPSPEGEAPLGDAVALADAGR